MMLVTDANILIRCVMGRAKPFVLALKEVGHQLLTTEHNLNESLKVLQFKMGMSPARAVAEIASTVRPFEVLGPGEYLSRRDDAAVRLRQGGQSDWPALAAALTLGAGIWSDDVDFFGVGVPVWSSMTARKVLLGQTSSAREQDHHG